MATTIIYPVYNNQYQTRVSQRKDLVKFFSEKGALSEQSAVSISPMVWAEIGINPDRDLNAYKHASYVIKDKEGKYWFNEQKMIKALEQEAVQYDNARKTVLVIFGLLALFASILIGIWALISL